MTREDADTLLNSLWHAPALVMERTESCSKVNLPRVPAILVFFSFPIDETQVDITDLKFLCVVLLAERRVSRGRAARHVLGKVDVNPQELMTTGASSY